MRVSRILVTVFSMFAMVVAAGAEEPQMPQPTAEHEVLGMWVGTWSGEGEMKPGAFGPGGPMAWKEDCSWFEGAKFHVVCTSEGDSPMGPMKGLGIVGYHPEKKAYTHGSHVALRTSTRLRP
jgi:hypothetical protein